MWEKKKSIDWKRLQEFFRHEVISRSTVTAVYKQVLLTHCIHRLRAPFNTFACWHFFITQLWFSFPTVALKQEIKPIADFRKDVCSPCPCHPVFHRGKGHWTEELSTGMGNFVSSLLRKSSWHSSGVLSHPQAHLFSSLWNWEVRQMDMGCRCRQKWQGEDQHLNSVPALSL